MQDADPCKLNDSGVKAHIESDITHRTCNLSLERLIPPQKSGRQWLDRPHHKVGSCPSQSTGPSPTQFTTAGGHRPPCVRPPSFEDLTSSKRITLKHPKKAPNQAPSPCWALPREKLSGGLAVAPREGSAGSLPRFRTRTASELQVGTCEIWRAELLQPVKSHLVLNPPSSVRRQTHSPERQRE